MSELLKFVQMLVPDGNYAITAHAHIELANDSIEQHAALEGVFRARVVEEYPQYHKGPCVLIAQIDDAGQAIHVLWGIPANGETCAYMITAYRPKPEHWTAEFTIRRPR